MRKIISLLILGACSSGLFAQDFTGLNTGNWAGVNTLHINPANVVDNRFKVDVNLFALHTNFGNDYIGMSLSPVFNPDLFSVPNFGDVYLQRDSLSASKNVAMNLRVQLPSFMFQITPKDAIGITLNSRVMMNVDEMSNDLAELIYNGIQENDLNLDFNGSFTTVNTLAWTEIGFVYGRVIMDQKQHFLKAGLTAKVLLGSAAAYGTMRDFRFRFNDQDTIEVLQGDVRYGHSGNLDLAGDGYNPLKVEGFGLGLDIGAVYEWRPHYARYKYNMDGKTDLWRKDKEKYLLRVGLSLVDAGYMRFTKAAGSRDYTANVSNLPFSYFDGVQNLYDFTEALAQIPGMQATVTDNENFNMATPMTLMATVDWQITDGVFLNLSPVLAFNKTSSLNSRVHGQNSIMITPRFEKRWFGFYMPIGFRELTGFHWGFSMRAGPLFFGSSAIFSNLLSDYPRGTDFHIGLKVPIPHGAPKDRDKDEVSDRKDRCRDVPGTWTFEGCPDTDKDGIPDSKDECPLEAGPERFRGCPDTDGDGVIDKVDRCPTEPGLVELMGCPDKDGDGVADGSDECPDEKGLAVFNGCPDTDGDSIPDKLDRCPTLAGPALSFGCPDTDGDGIFDDRDKCPTQPGLPELDGCPFTDSDKDGVRDIDDKCPDVAGPAENNGCPYADTDNDGIIDLEDKCPNTPGVKENAGCPEIAKEDKEVLQQAFDNLEFSSGKAMIAASSYASLDKLAELMRSKSAYNLLIEGHTDNVGNREANLSLSRNRSNAVKAYLVKKGVSSSRITAKFYGPDKPIADNTAEEGRQRNRRVEMTVIFK